MIGTVPKNLRDLSKIKKLGFNSVLKFSANNEQTHKSVLVNGDYRDQGFTFMELFINQDHWNEKQILLDISKLIVENIIQGKVPYVNIVENIFVQ